MAALDRLGAEDTAPLTDFGVFFAGKKAVVIRVRIQVEEGKVRGRGRPM